MRPSYLPEESRVAGGGLQRRPSRQYSLCDIDLRSWQYGVLVRQPLGLASVQALMDGVSARDLAELPDSLHCSRTTSAFTVTTRRFEALSAEHPGSGDHIARNKTLIWRDEGSRLTRSCDLGPTRHPAGRLPPVGPRQSLAVWPSDNPEAADAVRELTSCGEFTHHGSYAGDAMLPLPSFSRAASSRCEASGDAT